MKLLIASVAALTLVTGCSSREATDQKIVKACEAGLSTLLKGEKYPSEFVKTDSSTFSKEDLGRKVTIKATVKEKSTGNTGQDTYSCTFSESFLPGYINWNASLAQIAIGNDIYGKDSSGTIQGGLQDFLNLTDVVAKELE